MVQCDKNVRLIQQNIHYDIVMLPLRLEHRYEQAQERLTTLRKTLVEGESSEPQQLGTSAIKATGHKGMKAVK